MLDLFGTEYVVLVTHAAAESGWADAVGELRRRGFPLRIERCHASQLAGTPYADEQAVVVRPDSVAAGHVARSQAVSPAAFPDALLPVAV